MRTHSLHQLEHFQQQNVGRVVMGERELALGMAEYALRGLGLSEDRSRLSVQAVREARVED